MNGTLTSPVENNFLLEQFFYHCRIKNLTAKTLECYTERLTYFIRYLTNKNKTLQEVDKVLLQSYIMSLLEPKKVSAETINGRIRVYKLFYRFLFENELIETNPSERIELLKVDRTIKEIVPPERLSLALKCFNQQSFCGSRNRLMILMTYDTMIRSGELINLKTDDVDFGAMLIKVHGKSRRERVIPFSVKTARAAQRFLLKHRTKKSGDRMFCKIDGSPLDIYRVYKIFREGGKHIGIQMGPHLIRHSGATQYTRLGGHLSVLQKLLGHCDIRTTTIYLHDSVDEMSLDHKRFSPMESVEV